MSEIDPFEDGVTHVNIYSQGRTPLGRFLSNYAVTPISTEDGDFKSIEGYWYWLSVQDDRLRRMSGYAAKKLGRQLRAPDWREDTEFRRKITLALAVKLVANPEMLLQLTQLGLPLDHYYVVSGLHVVCPSQGRWVVEFYEAVRTGETPVWKLVEMARRHVLTNLEVRDEDTEEVR